MKPIYILLLIVIAGVSCNNPATVPNASDTKKDSPVATTAPVYLPYKMEYTNWTMGDPQNLKIVLDMYRNWDDNKTNEAAAAFGDSAIFDDANGIRAITTKETIADSLRTWRGIMVNHYTDVISGLSLHSTDKNEDWVTIQSVSKWTTKEGETDSVVATDNWLLKNGKIVYLASFQQKPIVNP